MGVVLPKKSGKTSGNWQVTFQYKGQKYSFTSGSPIREVAEAMEPGFRAQVEQEHAALTASGPAVTFNEAMGAYYRVRILGASKEGKTPEEIEEFELAGFDALAYAGQLVGLDTRCADVNTTRMIEIVQHLKNGKIGSGSGKRKAGAINKRTQLIFAVLNFARDHLATPLPNRPRMREVKLPEGERHRIIDYRDEAAICAHLEDMLQLAFVLELETGIRRGDVVGLKWDRVTLLDGSDGEFGQILAHVKSKGRQLYPVPLNARAAEILRMLKGLHPEYVFTRVVQTRRTAHGRTTMVTTRAPYKKEHFSKRFRIAFKKAGVKDVTFHDLRRTAGTRYYLACKDYEQTRKFLGHSSLDVTKRYIKLALESVAEGVRAMDRMRGERGVKIAALKLSLGAPALATADRETPANDDPAIAA